MHDSVHKTLNTSIVLVKKFKTEGKPLLPTYTSASTFKCSYRTSIVGISIPTLSIERRKDVREMP